jgi:hypothetical protein
MFTKHPIQSAILLKTTGATVIALLCCLGGVISAHAEPNSATTAPAETVRLLPPPAPAQGTGLSSGLLDVGAMGSATYTRGDSGARTANRVAKAAESMRGAVAGTTVSVTSTCPQGQTLQAGSGAAGTNGGSSQVSLLQSYASGTTGWTAIGIVSGSGLAASESLDVIAVAVCG